MKSNYRVALHKTILKKQSLFFIERETENQKYGHGASKQSETLGNKEGVTHS